MKASDMKCALLGTMMAIHLGMLCDAADDRKSLRSLPAEEQARIHREVLEASKLLASGEAKATLEIVTEITDDVACHQAEVLLGGALLQLRQFAKGQEAFQRALKIAPDLYEARFNLAEIEFISGRFEKALDGFRMLEGKRNDYSDIIIQYKIFLCLLKLEQDTQAKERYIRMPKDTSLFRFSHAAVHFSKGKTRHGVLSTQAAMKGAQSPREINVFVDSFVELGWIEVDDEGMARAGSGKLKGPAAPPLKNHPS